MAVISLRSPTRTKGAVITLKNNNPSGLRTFKRDIIDAMVPCRNIVRVTQYGPKELLVQNIDEVYLKVFEDAVYKTSLRKGIGVEDLRYLDAQ